VGAACSGGGSEKKDSSASKADTAEETAAPAAESSATPEQAADTATGAAAPAAAAPTAAPAPGTPAETKAATPKSAAASAAAPSGGAKPAAAAAPAPGTPAPAPGTPVPTPAAPGQAKANYDSDVGVTADTIRIGTINMTSATRSLGPAIAGVQEQALDAAVKYVNRNGGVSGRKLQLVTCDDGGDITRGRACYEKLKGNVFALMPSISWLTDVIHDRLVADKLPWMSWGWFKSEYEDPWMFPCHANGMREAKAAANWVAKVLKPKTVGIMYLNVSEDIAARDTATKELAANGIDVVASVAQEWDSPDESQHVLQMRSANPDLVMSFSWPAPVAKFLHDADTQNWEPPKGYIANHLTGDPGYGPIFGDYIKDRMNTITSWTIVTGDDPNNADANTPEQQLHREEMLRTNGREYSGFKWRYSGNHHITQSGWICTLILAKAAGELGADLTREGFKNVLESKGWATGFGVTLYWPKGDHNANPYSFNREFIYKWTGHPDGGWDFKRGLPDPVYDCGAGNIQEGSKTVCNS
jgi:ABC-type branched-subunit amino acid transport system substrate-binding protein